MTRRNAVLVRGEVGSKSVLGVVLDSLPSDEVRLEFPRELCISTIALAFQSKPRNAVQVPRTSFGEVSLACSVCLAKIGAWLRPAQRVRRVAQTIRQLWQPERLFPSARSPNEVVEKVP